MKWMSLLELKKLFVEFFKEKEHLYLESFPLIPKDDFSLLFINSGMAPMKKWFLNEQTPPRRRVVTVQRCIRTGDLERVGKTDRHGTFFEMLGNFSFGDYFKREAIFFAWEFIFNVLEMPKEKLYITVFEEDSEAYSIWEKEIGINPSHIVKLGKEDNFWEIGTGPCGPCSEIYFDRGLEHGCGKKDCAPGCECDRFIEFWNLVFSQYDNKGSGKYCELSQKNIDTGMGLERLACIFQGVDNLFEVDSVKKILDKVCLLANIEYKKDKEKDVLVRIITDHIRSVVYLICDGVIPSNEGRGYVLKRLIRRAHKSGKQLGIYGDFLCDVAKVVFENDLEIKNKFQYVVKILKNEEEAFEKILKASEEKVFVSIEEAKRKKRLFVFVKANEIFSKTTANFLALEEEVSGFFTILKTEIERLFLAVVSKEVEEYYENYFNTQLKLIKEKLFNYVLKLKSIVELTKDFSEEIFMLEEKSKEIVYLISFEKISCLKQDEIEGEKENLKNIIMFCDEKIKDILGGLKEKFKEYPKNKEFLKEEILTFEETKKEQKELDLKLSTISQIVLKIAELFNISIEKDIFLNPPKISDFEAFKLCDTYGMPFDILKEIAFENGVDVDEEGFLKLMQQQKERAKKAANFKDSGWEKEEKSFENLPKTEFIGYFEMSCEAKVLYIFLEKELDYVEKGEKVEIVFNKTPIYAVSGGQLADRGKIYKKDTNSVLGNITGCRRLETGQYVAIVEVLEKIEKGEVVVVEVDRKRREKIKRNHTAAHILQKALILNLGEHVRQAGQEIDEKKLRFDFTHFEALKEEEIKKIENSVNEVIFKKLDVFVREMEKEKAKEEGAIALFDEKYGEVVRVVEISGFSKEFCGGTHVENTSEIGVFKIISEGSVGSGVRRIEAITSEEVLRYLEKIETRLNMVCSIFKVKTASELEERAKNIILDAKENCEKLSCLKLKLCENEFFNKMKEESFEIKNFKVMVFCENILNKKELRIFADCLKNKEKKAVVLVFVKFEEKYNFLVVCGKEAVLNRAKANEIVKELANLVGGKGGGKEDFAMAGIKNFEEKEKIKESFFEILRRL